MKPTKLFILSLAVTLFACNPSNTPEEKPVAEKPDWYYTGGQLGTAYSTASNCFLTSSLKKM